MNHADWTARFKEAIALSTDDPRRASALLVQLAEEAQGASKDHLNEWHEQQALGTAGTFLEEAGDLDGAIEMYQKTLELCKGWAGYWSRATTSMLAIIALLQFRRGMDEEAMQTGEEALRFLGREPESGAILADLMKQMAQRRTKRSAGEQ
jgi:tetratricopeptide (TPR) repeat protein